MSNIKKLMMSAAGGEALNVEDVFSTYLYTGTGSAQTITNGLDLSGEGGMVWTKSRSNAANHVIVDTAQGAYACLSPNLTSQKRGANTVTAFSSSGYTVANDTSDAVFQNTTGVNGQDYASWTFRKAPKFFDVVTYTGDASDQVVSHSLGSTPGCIIIKPTSGTGDWIVYHRGLTNNGANHSIKLNTTAAQVNQGGLVATDSTFTLYHTATVNTNNVTYVAYLFAHNDGDGEFGPDGDQDIIKCGSYTGNGSPNGPTINLGFEPQWLLYKRTDSSGVWEMFDSMRGFTVDGVNDARLMANYEYSEGFGSLVTPLANGFKLTNNGSDRNASGGNYIYIAIRRGTKVPESGTEVFAIDTKSTPAPAYSSGFPVDMAIQRNIGVATNNSVATRLLQQKRLLTDSTNAEESSVTFKFDYSTGYSSDANFNDSNNYSWMWKRAPGFFDVVTYTGNGSSSRTVSHNLGVAPEMVWVRARNASVYSWIVQGTAIEAGKRLELNENYALSTTFGGVSNLTSTSFDLGNWNNVNGSTTTYIAYLFASLPGISKVGSFTTTSGALSVDCGFTSGARFILMKKTNIAEDWVLFDSARGIVAGDDPFINPNNTNSETTNTDPIDPLSSGFIVNGSFWGSGHDYIFYAIA